MGVKRLENSHKQWKKRGTFGTGKMVTEVKHYFLLKHKLSLPFCAAIDLIYAKKPFGAKIPDAKKSANFSEQNECISSS